MAGRHVRTDTPAWPLAVLDETRVFASERMPRPGTSVLVACHDDDGDWVSSRGTTHTVELALVACLVGSRLSLARVVVPRPRRRPVPAPARRRDRGPKS